MRFSVHLVLWFAFLSTWGTAAAQTPAGDVGQGAPDTAQFNKLFDQRAQLIGELRSLDEKYSSSPADQQKAIIERAKEIVKELTALHTQLIKLAEQIYLAAPDSDPRIQKLLEGHCEGCFEVEDYEEALRIAKMLIDRGDKEKTLYLWGGIAAFCVGEPDLAEKYLNTAKKQGVELQSGKGNPLDPTFLMFLQNPAKHKAAWKKEQEIRAAEAQADDLPRVLFKTNKGDIEIELFENEAPNTVANIISLVESGYYNGLPFHRVLPGFMAQGGDNGRGGPGYTIPCECHQPNYRKHFRGTLSMAHAGRDTGGAQFFLTFIPTTHLDGVHTVFGRVVKGMDVLAKIRRRDPDAPDAAMIVPDKIIEAKVLRKRPHEYVVKKAGSGQ